MYLLWNYSETRRGILIFFGDIMPSAIFTTKEEAIAYKKYIRGIYRGNISFLTSDFDNEIVYVIPFHIR